MLTDLVMMTYNRPEYLRRTYETLRERTHSPYRLHIINDGSDHVLPSLKADTLVLRKENRGVPINLLTMRGLVLSEVFVLMGDDVLCPDVEPDWLARGLAAMNNYPDLGMLGLNESDTELTNSRHVIERGEPITWCGRIGGQIIFIRRKILFDCPEEQILGQKSPVKQLCIWANNNDWRSGFLTSTYAWHFGEHSVRLNDQIYITEEPEDLKTLKPRGVKDG